MIKQDTTTGKTLWSDKEIINTMGCDININIVKSTFIIIN